MAHMDPRVVGRREGVRWAITWLHKRALEMNDPHAQAILNVAADDIGHQAKSGGYPVPSDQ